MPHSICQPALDDLRCWVDLMAEAAEQPGTIATWEGIATETVNDIAEGRSTWPNEMLEVVNSYRTALDEALDIEGPQPWRAADSAMVYLAMMLIEQATA